MTGSFPKIPWPEDDGFAQKLADFDEKLGAWSTAVIEVSCALQDMAAELDLDGSQAPAAPHEIEEDGAGLGGPHAQNATGATVPAPPVTTHGAAPAAAAHSQTIDRTPFAAEAADGAGRSAPPASAKKAKSAAASTKKAKAAAASAKKAKPEAVSAEKAEPAAASAATANDVETAEPLEDESAQLSASLAHQMDFGQGRRRNVSNGSETEEEQEDPQAAVTSSEDAELLASLDPEIAKWIRVRRRFSAQPKSVRELLAEYEHSKDSDSHKPSQKKRWWGGK